MGRSPKSPPYIPNTPQYCDYVSGGVWDEGQRAGLREHWPVWFEGLDKNNAPLQMVDLKTLDLEKAIAAAGGLDRLILFTLLENEKTLRHRIPEAEAAAAAAGAVHNPAALTMPALYIKGCGKIAALYKERARFLRGNWGRASTTQKLREFFLKTTKLYTFVAILAQG